MAQIDNLFASLYSRNADSFTINPNCLMKLEEILRNLLMEDRTLRTYRRAIVFGHNIKRNLIPLLAHAKASMEITNTIIKILVDLTVPVEYLLSIEAVSRTEVGRHTIFELNKLLVHCKELFADNRHTKLIMDHVKFLIDSDRMLEHCDGINNCLLLLRNILHVPEAKSEKSGPLSHSSIQNQIIWNLFTQSIDKVVIYLISRPPKVLWGVTLVQLVALLYKDQHVGTLQKLLNLWLETSLSESSEDNESNTSPPDRGSGDDSSPIITSDPTSDSSDGGSAGKRTKKAFCGMARGKSMETETSTSSGISSTAYHEKNMNKGHKRECPSSQSEDFGYVTQVENQESISTSSNEDEQPQPVHQKPYSYQKCRYNSGKTRTTSPLDKKELRRKKLVKRSKTNTINMKGLMYHLPTDEDIANILKEFTVDFLLKGYGALVHDLHSQFLSNIHLQIDTSHFFWLISYFLKFATQLELDLEHVAQVLSYDILSFLVFQGVWVYEKLEMERRIANADLAPCLRRLHLVVTAIKELLLAVESYGKMTHLSEADRGILDKFAKQIVEMDDLRSLFVLLLRQFNPNVQSRQYLQDLILTNHNYLLFLDSASKGPCPFNIMEHLKQYATVEIMQQYGLLLENFKDNGLYVNNCIFTMMHHIGGDLEHVTTLFQPSILKTFSQIWETDYEICDDWFDLIEYIIHKFINSPRSNSDLNSVVQDKSDEELTAWTEEEKDNLVCYYNQNRNSQDAIANITKKYEMYGVKQKSQLSIIRQLLEQKIISERQYDDFLKVKRQPDQLRSAKKYLFNIEETSIDDGIRILRDYLHKDNKHKFVSWLQNVLIDACYVKLTLANPEEFKHSPAIREPVIYYFALLNMPIPLVPWTGEQDAILKYQAFVLLLHKLGLYLPINTGKIFVSIPNFWNAEHVFSIAQQLGPIDLNKLKFDVAILFNGSHRKSDLKKDIVEITDSLQKGNFSINERKSTSSIDRHTPLPWFQTNTIQYSVEPILGFAALLPSARPLSIAIPGFEQPPCLLLSPGIADNRVSHPNDQLLHTTMDCSPTLDDNEHNSICETASIASDLTRMCVSDEEEKLILVIHQK